MADHVKTFKGNEDFEAVNAAEHFLRFAGFSVGSNERGKPRGIMFGDYTIAKWRNLHKQDIDALHGKMTSETGSMRDGPVTVRIFDSAPHAAKRAFHMAALALSE